MVREQVVGDPERHPEHKPQQQRRDSESRCDHRSTTTRQVDEALQVRRQTAK